MARRLIVDTGILIALERGLIPPGRVLTPEDDVAMSAVTLAELTHGAIRAHDNTRARRQEFINDLVSLLPVEAYDAKVARIHGELLAYTFQAGQRRGAYDLIIAATAVLSQRTIMTTDRRASFADLPGVLAEVVPVEVS